MNTNLAYGAVGLVVGILATLGVVANKGDPLTQINKCLTDKRCTVSRYEYTPYVANPQANAPTCPIYQMPKLAGMPSAAELSANVSRHPKQTQQFLMEYIEMGLKVTDENGTILSKSYSAYLAKCGASNAPGAATSHGAEPVSGPVPEGRPLETSDVGWEFLPKDEDGLLMLE
jgi:hypothetical protein